MDFGYEDFRYVWLGAVAVLGAMIRDAVKKRRELRKKAFDKDILEHSIKLKQLTSSPYEKTLEEEQKYSKDKK